MSSDQGRESASMPREGARERIIKTALHLFALHGIEGVRTRTLAVEAGVNQSAIPYYFGGKDGVYTAVIGSIAEDLAVGFQRSMSERKKKSAIAEEGSTTPATNLREIVEGFAMAVLSPGDSLDRTMLIVREQLKPTENFDILYEHFIGPLHVTVGRLVAKMQSLNETDPEVIIQAHALIGQVLSFVVAQQAYLRRSGKKKMSTADVTKISSIVAAMSVCACEGNHEIPAEKSS